MAQARDVDGSQRTADVADPDQVDRIVAFLAGIGIPVTFENVTDHSFLPAIAIRHGGLVVDRARLRWPGDLLHEAGHIVVTDPQMRPTLTYVADDPAEEMAAIGWSYAAARAAGIAPEVVFHAEGYGAGGGGWLVDAFTGGTPIGLPLLHYWGMTADPARAVDPADAYPRMRRWLR